MVDAKCRAGLNPSNSFQLSFYAERRTETKQNTTDQNIIGQMKTQTETNPMRARYAGKDSKANLVYTSIEENTWV